jgi:hypothetical protein
LVVIAPLNRKLILTQIIPPRLKELVDEQLFNFAQAAQKHHKNNDLVVFLDLTEENAELVAIPRGRLANSNEIPEQIQKKLSSPASEFAKVLNSPSQSFWFFVIYENGEAACIALNASMLALGGSA